MFEIRELESGDLQTVSPYFVRRICLTRLSATVLAQGCWDLHLKLD